MQSAFSIAALPLDQYGGMASSKSAGGAPSSGGPSSAMFATGDAFAVALGGLTRTQSTVLPPIVVRSGYTTISCPAQLSVSGSFVMSATEFKIGGVQRQHFLEVVEVQNNFSLLSAVERLQNFRISFNDL